MLSPELNALLFMFGFLFLMHIPSRICNKTTNSINKPFSPTEPLK